MTTIEQLRNNPEATANDYKPLVTIPTLEEVHAVYVNDYGHEPYRQSGAAYPYRQGGDDTVLILHEGPVIDAYAKKIGRKDWYNLPWEETCAVIQLFTEAVDADYYSRCKEDFFEWEAAKLALEKGKSIVICENLS